MSRLRTLALLAASLTLASAGPAHAQGVYWGGSASAGKGNVDGRMVDPQFHLMGSWHATYVTNQGVSLGIRGMLGYSRLRRNLGAHLDSLGLADGQMRGGNISAWESGGDLVLGVNTGIVEVHGFYGLHLYEDFYEPADIVRTPDAPADEAIRLRRRARVDFGTARGAGVTLRIPDTTGGVFAEWYQGHGYDPRMLRLSGVRFGLTWDY